MALAHKETESQIEEVQLLRSCTTGDEFNWLLARGDADEQVKRWEARCAGKESDSEPFAFGIRLSIEPACQLEVRMRKPGASDEHQLAVTGQDVAAKELQALRDVCAQRWQASKDEGVEHRIFDVFTALQEHIVDHPLSSHGDAQQMPKESSQEAKSSPPSPPPPPPPPPPLSMSRTIFWSHHLIAPSKRRDFAKWSSELSLWVVLKIGYPGYLCFEGKSEDVTEVVRRVKGLQWHAINVRSEEEWICEPKEGEDAPSLEARALLSCPLASTSTPVARGEKVRTTCEELEGMSEIVERLRAAGLSEEELVDALGLRTKAGAGPGKSSKQ
ncbi:hypothetical protein BDZ90DRAFT_229193 [Jaminaea rosea]|uniref:Uncharacterized protein n=1 Tax=Jaminaea rosea TaxID=1569628 RepID=A0A316UYU5_9BASI|nr:hypothetical protein BDZ90DRAFT_229193 [Jaminaea rosea]PWN30164.1 hypothetical protein BDZ90DRAFT_229193 [Jaminaea rosea]